MIKIELKHIDEQIEILREQLKLSSNTNAEIRLSDLLLLKEMGDRTSLLILDIDEYLDELHPIRHSNNYRWFKKQCL